MTSTNNINNRVGDVCCVFLSEEDFFFSTGGQTDKKGSTLNTRAGMNDDIEPESLAFFKT